MKKKLSNMIYYFGLLSFAIGALQIVIGQIDYNSLIDGFKMSYIYFVIGFIMIALD